MAVTSHPTSIVASERRIDDIESLRAIAIIYVLIAHLPALLGNYGAQIDYFDAFFNLGSGVDLFFVISGFVIARSLFREYPGDEIHWRNVLSFWVRRAFRIWPAAWCWLAVSLVATAFFNKSGVFGHLATNARDALAAALQYANIYLWQCNVLLTRTCAAGGVPNGIYWSLSLEEQFYLVLPLVALVLNRRWRLLMLLAAMCLQLATPKIGLWWFVRSDGLIAGVLLAMVPEAVRFRFEPRVLQSAPTRAAIMTLLLLALGLLSSNHAMAISSLAGSTPPFVGIALVYIGSFGRGYVGSFGRMKPVVMWIGSRSYALYLSHMIVYCATQELWISVIKRFGTDIRYTLAFSVTALFLLVICAEANYRLIETPMRRWGRRLAGRIQAGSTSVDGPALGVAGDD